MVEGKEPMLFPLIRGGGTGAVGKRKATTSLERKGGRVEYFINSVTIDSRDNTQMEEPRMNLNAPAFFIVIEPTAWDSFREAAQIAPQMAGHKTYIGALLLTVEFIDINRCKHYTKSR